MRFDLLGFSFSYQKTFKGYLNFFHVYFKRKQTPTNPLPKQNFSLFMLSYDHLGLVVEIAFIEFVNQPRQKYIAALSNALVQSRKKKFSDRVKSMGRF